MSLSAPLKDIVRKVTGCCVESARSVSGGDISNAVLVDLSDGGSVFVKYNSASDGALFDAEAIGLQELRKANAIRVPEVIHVEPRSSSVPPCIIMEALPAGTRTDATESELGAQLACMHRYRGEKFGFSSDNFIGSLPQRNDEMESWPDFFLTQRLGYQITLAQESGWWGTELEKLFSSKRERIRALLAEVEEEPSLLHGDLWDGNVFWCVDGPAIIDPAVYYGHREVDLAMSELFGRRGQSFYLAYHEEYPIQEGYEKRREILNLYHWMTHSNMFGGGYVGSFAASLGSI